MHTDLGTGDFYDYTHSGVDKELFAISFGIYFARPSPKDFAESAVNFN